MLLAKQNHGSLQTAPGQVLGSLMEREASLSWDVRRGAGCESDANSYFCLLSGRWETKLKGVAHGARETSLKREREIKALGCVGVLGCWNFPRQLIILVAIYRTWYFTDQEWGRLLSTEAKLLPCLMSQSHIQEREFCGGFFIQLCLYWELYILGANYEAFQVFLYPYQFLNLKYVGALHTSTLKCPDSVTHLSLTVTLPWVDLLGLVLDMGKSCSTNLFMLCSLFVHIGKCHAKHSSFFILQA